MVQAFAGVVTAALLGPWLGARAALSALCGAAAIAAGSALFARWTPADRVEPAGRVLARLVLATLSKWLAIAVLLGLAMASGRLDAGLVLAGALVAIVVHLLFLTRWLR
ncbi:MAG: ATP synthase subunit I [Xanthomonadales bacterium]|nr:ATP synthase subunit I [Xanthomonadales bacterium]